MISRKRLDERDGSKLEIKRIIDEFSTMGKRLTRMAHGASPKGDKSTNRAFGKALKAYQKFFAELKVLNRMVQRQDYD